MTENQKIKATIRNLHKHGWSGFVDTTHDIWSFAWIEEVIETGFEIPAKRERIGKAKIYEFNQERHGKFYEQKRVELFYVIEGKMIVTVTVYVFYGKWEI